ncbi:MAG: hypothetical protein AB7N71_08330 [Phycisphaerae bacterium]
MFVVFLSDAALLISLCLREFFGAAPFNAGFAPVAFRDDFAVALRGVFFAFAAVLADGFFAGFFAAFLALVAAFFLDFATTNPCVQWIVRPPGSSLAAKIPARESRTV